MNPTLRDHFATHAPPAPDWWNPVGDPLPPRPEGAAPCKGCREDGDCDDSLPCKMFRAWSRDCSNVRHENAMMATALWRFAWADAMLEAREVRRIGR